MIIKKKLLKFVIIGAIDTDNTKDLMSEIEKQGHTCCLCRLDEIAIEFFNGKTGLSYREKNLLDFDIFIFRGFSLHPLEARIIARILVENKKTIIDRVLGEAFLMGKIYESLIFASNKIPQPRTFQALALTAYEKILENMKFPIIVKPIDGQQGRGISKFINRKAALDFFKKNPEGYLGQEYFPIDGDYRVFIVGDKVLGAMKRFVIRGDFRSNASLGAEARKVSVTFQMKKIALEAKRVMGLDIAGVDLMKHGNKWFVLEVNHTPQWQKFKEVTKINPAEEIIKYAVKKYGKN